MTTAKKKKSPARKRSLASRAAAFGIFRIKRFVLSAGASALASFQIASCSFDPASSADKLLNQALAALHIQALNIPALSALNETLSAFRKNGWPDLDAPAGHTSSVGGKVDKVDVTASGQPTRFANCSQFFPGGKAPTLQDRKSVV